jgi:two-component sensor histidine kinase
LFHLLDACWELSKPYPGERAWLKLLWIECGIQLPQVRENAHKGFGRQLIETALPAQLQAKTSLNFERDGLRCLIEIPLSSPV